MSDLLDPEGCNVPPGQDEGVEDRPGVFLGEGGDDAVHDDAEGQDADEDEQADGDLHFVVGSLSRRNSGNFSEINIFNIVKNVSGFRGSKLTNVFRSLSEVFIDEKVIFFCLLYC